MPSWSKERLLLGGGLGDPAQTDFAAVGGGQDDVGALQRRKQRERLMGDNGCALRRRSPMASERWRPGASADASSVTQGRIPETPPARAP